MSRGDAAVETRPREVWGSAQVVASALDAGGDAEDACACAGAVVAVGGGVLRSVGLAKTAPGLDVAATSDGAVPARAAMRGGGGVILAGTAAFRCDGRTVAAAPRLATRLELSAGTTLAVGEIGGFIVRCADDGVRCCADDERDDATFVRAAVLGLGPRLAAAAVGEGVCVRSPAPESPKRSTRREAM